MLSILEEFDSATENHGYDSDMICVNHILFYKLPGNLRTSANPYILS